MNPTRWRPIASVYSPKVKDDLDAVVTDIVATMRKRLARAQAAARRADAELRAARWNLDHLKPEVILRVARVASRQQVPTDALADAVLPGDPWRHAIVHRILVRLFSPRAQARAHRQEETPQDPTEWFIEVHALTCVGDGVRNNPMAIKLLPDGTIVADTPEDLVKTMALLGKVSRLPPVQTEEGSDVEPEAPGSWDAFTAAMLGPRFDKQRALLNAVKAAGSDGISRGSLVSDLEAESPMAIGGWVGGISKVCARAGVDPAEVLIREGDLYKPGPLLLANDVGSS